MILSSRRILAAHCKKVCVMMDDALQLRKDIYCSPAYGQAQLFEQVKGVEHEIALIKKLDELDEQIAGGILGYVTRCRNLLQATTDQFDGLVPEQPQGLDLRGDSGPGTAQFDELERLGVEEFGTTGFVLLAGGLGERLGFPGIKVSIPQESASEVSYLDLHCRAVKAMGKYAKTKVPLAIMTSDDTHLATKALFEANNYFGLEQDQVTLMKQTAVPAVIDNDANFCLNEDDSLITKPHGHGDVHSLLLDTGTLEKWRKLGKKRLVFFQDTNPLAFRSFAVLLGVANRERFTMCSLGVPRAPKEAAGCIMTLTDKSNNKLTINVEYCHLDALLAKNPPGQIQADIGIGEENISPFPANINCFAIEFGPYYEVLIQNRGVMPEFINPKWNSTRTAFKPARLETLMQDIPHLFPRSSSVGFCMLNRWFCFTALKNNAQDAAAKIKQGIPADTFLSTEAAIYDQGIRLLRLCPGTKIAEETSEVEFNGVTASIGARAVLLPEFGLTINHLREKIGSLRMTAKSLIICDGELPSEEKLHCDLDGALDLRTAVDVPKEVRNDKGQLVKCREFPATTQLTVPQRVEQIRGYRTV